MASATTSLEIEFIHLPSGELSSISPYIQPYKQYRLYSLLQAPNAFGSTYSHEVEFSDSIWQSRLLSPLANIFIAQYAIPPKSTSSEIKILCTLVMLGPLTIHPSVLHAAQNPWLSLASTEQILKEAAKPWHFRLNAIFTMPEARGRGLAKHLISMAVGCAREFAMQKKDGGFVVSIAVEEDNIAGKNLYEKCGFKETGEVVIEGRPGQPGHDGKRKILLLEYREDS